MLVKSAVLANVAVVLISEVVDVPMVESRLVKSDVVVEDSKVVSSVDVELPFASEVADVAIISLVVRPVVRLVSALVVLVVAYLVVLVVQTVVPASDVVVESVVKY